MENRKKDHINFAEESIAGVNSVDDRFYYEPALSPHPQGDLAKVSFLDYEMKAPIWISSMTGGTGQARFINENLAKACKEFGLGMGLGSCRILLEDDSRLADFALRPLVGYDSPFYANLGINQVDSLLREGKEQLVKEMLKRLEVDGLIIHINPIQEWVQFEGDRQTRTAVETIQEAIDKFVVPIIIKEVGQGMGPRSIGALMSLPIAALELGAYGGANFATIEALRKGKKGVDEPLSTIGHSAEEMIGFINQLGSQRMNCQQVIISGGVRNYLDGYYLINKCRFQSIYGQAVPLLSCASESYEALSTYLHQQIEGLKFSESFLDIR